MPGRADAKRHDAAKRPIQLEQVAPMAEPTPADAPLDSLTARYALTLSEPSSEGETPLGDEDLAALIDGRLTGASRDRVLAYLDRDPDAYQAWLMAAATIGAKTPAKTTIVRRWLLASAAAAALLFAAFFLDPLLGPSLESRIDAGFASLRGVHTVPSKIEPGYGFAANPATDPLIAAVQVGFDRGRTELVAPSRTQPDATAYPSAFQFGRWLVLLEACALASPSPSVEFWTEQLAIARQLEQGLAGLGPAPAAQTIRSAQRTLMGQLTPSPTTGNERWRRDLGAEIQRICLRLGLLDRAEAVPR
jgi:hypothetical protein